MVEKDAFLANPKHHIVHPNEETMTIVCITKKIEIIMSIQVYHISQINIIDKENAGNKSFSCKSKESISCITIGRNNCSAHNKKNIDYFEYPSLTHFTDDH